jgi:hypothetical protein
VKRAWCVLAAAAFALAAGGGALPAQAADTQIQPGALIQSPVGQCTMNFIFEDPGNGKKYVGTAGHCINLNQTATTQNGGALGQAVFRQSNAQLDFALIEIAVGRYGEINPAVRTWGGPTGATTSSETFTGDVLFEYGYGVGFGLLEATRPRIGVLQSDETQSYTADTGAVNGDSGAPLLHGPTGKALGIISHFNLVALPPSTDAGPTVEWILQRLVAAGFNVQIVTAPF